MGSACRHHRRHWLRLLASACCSALPYCIAFAVTVALPAWWLGHLALLRTASCQCRLSNGAARNARAEWYPVGRILLWIAALPMLATIAALLTLGSDARSHQRRACDAACCGFSAPPSRHRPADVERWVDALVIIARRPHTYRPDDADAQSLARRQDYSTSGRLHRPGRIEERGLPSMTLVALSVALAFCLPAACWRCWHRIVTTALMMAYAPFGFASAAHAERWR